MATDAQTLRLQASYSARRIAALSGLSYRMVDWYDRAGILRPSLHRARGSGTRRAYSDDDLCRAKFIAALVGLGAKAEVVRHALSQLDDDPALWPRWLFVEVDGTVKQYAPAGSAWFGVSVARLLAEKPEPLHAVPVAV